MDIESQIFATSCIVFGVISLLAQACVDECSDTFAIIGATVAVLSVVGMASSGLCIIWF